MIDEDFLIELCHSREEKEPWQEVPREKGGQFSFLQRGLDSQLAVWFIAILLCINTLAYRAGTTSRYTVPIFAAGSGFESVYSKHNTHGTCREVPTLQAKWYVL